MVEFGCGVRLFWKLTRVIQLRELSFHSSHFLKPLDLTSIPSSDSTLYPGYSSDFHDGEHQIIVGACYVTPPRCARATFVNWYQGPYPYVLAGARIVYDI